LTISCQRDDDVEELTDCIDLAFLKGEWAGEFDQYNYGRYPMFMNVDRVEGCRFYGILRWPTLRNSITTMEGYFKNDTLFWTEPSLIQGSNIILDGDYIAPFTSKNRLDGSWYFPNQPTREGGVFSISKD
jgi:hypothetical protein